MHFPLSQLPLELALEILRLAASPSVHPNQSQLHVYQTACSLARVSHNVRQAVMPHLLHTVILSSQDAINLFIRTLEQQQYLASINSRLKLDYSRHVRRIWGTRCWQPLVQQPTNYYQNYRLLYNLFGKAEAIGFDFNSLHLLYEVLGDAHSDSLDEWNCNRVTFAGEGSRWNPITSTAAGLSFLKRLTHLTMWSPTNDTIGAASASDVVPNWVQRVPFELMPNLTHFAFSLITSPGSTMSPVLVYSLPTTASDAPQEGATIFRKWALSDNPLDYGTMYRLDVEYPQFSNSVPEISWEKAFLLGENDNWPRNSRQ
ncbi:hypothetical protein BDZ97DRAFT_1916514 [Flammula alnicola]|nr:hypothetical protein BDZ97DRAFT_1916514 [Flammula alnicola]